MSPAFSRRLERKNKDTVCGVLAKTQEASLLPLFYIFFVALILLVNLLILLIYFTYFINLHPYFLYLLIFCLIVHFKFI
jgi:hypothetical protein